MNGKKSIILRFNSNINRFKLEIFDCTHYYCKTICSSSEIIRVCPKSKYLRIIVSPLYDGYYNKVFYKINTDETCELSLSISFLKRNIPAPQKYTFFLIDRNYGLKINGELSFNLTYS